MPEWYRRRYVALYSPTFGRHIVDTYAKRMWLMRSRIFAWSKIMTAECEKEGYRKVMITLTLAKPESYKPGIINDYIKKIKQSLGKRLVAFAWVAEMQRRGALHYHVLLAVEKGTNIPVPDKSGMWAYGMSRIETAKTYYYVCKYVGKEYQKNFEHFPKSARLYSASIRGSKELQLAFRILSQLNVGKKESTSDWSYVGATATTGYADLILDSHCAKI